MSVQLDQISATPMLSVAIQLPVMSVPAMSATLEMVSLAVSKQIH